MWVTLLSPLFQKPIYLRKKLQILPPRKERNSQMEERVVVALIASLSSQALLSLFLPTSKSSPLSLFPPLSKPNNNSNLHPQFLSLLLHLLSNSQIAVTTSLLSNPNKKRKRQQHQEPSSSSSPNRNPDHFNHFFGMSSSTFQWLSGLVDPLLDCRDPAFCSSLRLLNSPSRLALALHRLFAGAPYSDIAARFAVSEPAARFCTKRLCRVLCTNFRFWVAFPSSPIDLTSVSDGFQAISNGLPGCCGAIACARFEITGGRHVAAQIVADSSSRILSIAAGFHGEKRNDEVLQRSTLYKDVEAGRVLGCGQFFVGDAGYPLLPWLMVPYANPVSGSIEGDFNAVHSLMCLPVKRVLSSLKHWKVMSRLMEEEDGKMAVACIGTCALLHNVLLMREDSSAFSDESMENSVSVGICGVEDCGGEKKDSEMRRTLALRARAARNSGQQS